MTRARRGARSGVPLLLVPPAVIGLVFLALPTLGLLYYAPWSRLRQIYGQADVDEALRISLTSAFEATGVALVLGVPLALVLARLSIPGLRVLRALVTMPLVLPPVVGGVALLLVLRCARGGGPSPQRVVRDRAALQPTRRRDRADLRRHAVPGGDARGRVPHR